MLKPFASIVGGSLDMRIHGQLTVAPHAIRSRTAAAFPATTVGARCGVVGAVGSCASALLQTINQLLDVLPPERFEHAARHGRQFPEDAVSPCHVTLVSRQLRLRSKPALTVTWLPTALPCPL